MKYNEKIDRDEIGGGGSDGESESSGMRKVGGRIQRPD